MRVGVSTGMKAMATFVQVCDACRCIDVLTWWLLVFRFLFIYVLNICKQGRTYRQNHCLYNVAL